MRQVFPITHSLSFAHRELSNSLDVSFQETPKTVSNESVISAYTVYFSVDKCKHSFLINVFCNCCNKRYVNIRSSKRDNNQRCTHNGASAFVYNLRNCACTELPHNFLLLLYNKSLNYSHCANNRFLLTHIIFTI